MDVQTLDKTHRASSASGNGTPMLETKRCTGSPGWRPRLTAAGAGALLFDPGTGVFDAAMQTRLHAMAKRIEMTLCTNHTTEVVLGVNNVLLIFNPLEVHPDDASEVLLQLWEITDAEPVFEKLIEIPVIYGGTAGEDLIALATGAGLGIDEYVRLHSEATYSVACIGSMPGFAYMTGLPPELAVPRRKVPRMKVDEGTVIVGGSQAGVMPCTAPSGWHLLGRTDRKLFDPTRSPPCLFEPGNQVRFVVAGVDA
jgi:KipI family sensor histidine kinase inhibitor